MRPSSETLTEKEATLIVCSMDPRSVLEEITRLTSIAGFHLEAVDSRRIHDVYFDTGQGALKAVKWALRVREVGAMRWITLKGPQTPIDSVSVERTEIEMEWSPDAWRKAVEQLLKLGVELDTHSGVFYPSQPQAAMESLGLEKIQDRETMRRVREIFSTKKSNLFSFT